MAPLPQTWEPPAIEPLLERIEGYAELPETKRRAFAEALQDAQVGWFLCRARADSLTDKQRAERFNRIRLAARDLLSALGAQDQGRFRDDVEGLPESLLYGEGGLFCSIEAAHPDGLPNITAEAVLNTFIPRMLRDIENIRRYAEWSYIFYDERAEGTPPDEKHKGDPALNYLCQQLIGIWHKTFGGPERPNVGRTGPLYSFLKIAIDGLTRIDDETGLHDRAKRALARYVGELGQTTEN